MAIEIITSVMTAFAAPLTSYIGTTASTVASSINNPLILGATIYIVMMGMFVATGRTQMSMGDFIWNCIRLSIICILVSKADTYNYYVTELFYNSIPDGVGQMLVGAAGDAPSADQIKTGAAFDVIISDAIDIGLTISQNSGLTDVATKIFAYFFIIMSTLVMTLMSIIVLFAKVGLAIVIAIGPFFIAMSMFDATRGYTANWMSMVANFTILQVLIYALFGLLLSVIKVTIASAAATSGGDSLIAAIAGLATFVLALVVAGHLPGMASSLAGSGVHLGSSLMNSALGIQRTAAGYAGLGAARGTAWLARKGWGGASQLVHRPNRMTRD